MSIDHELLALLAAIRDRKITDADQVQSILREAVDRFGTEKPIHPVARVTALKACARLIRDATRDRNHTEPLPFEIFQVLSLVTKPGGRLQQTLGSEYVQAEVAILRRISNRRSGETP
ncbi:MAG TPA: hypothetical protein VGG64_19450 [Pirellulales bacterium]|jgi:hypothetical protein